jgi:hypothetical protein
MREVYVASRAANAACAVGAEHIIETCAYGPDPLGDAKSYAKDYTAANDAPAYVYRVVVEPVHKYDIRKEVVGSAHTL